MHPGSLFLRLKGSLLPTASSRVDQPRAPQPTPDTMTKKQRLIRRILYTSILLLTGWYVANHLQELELIARTLVEAKPLWLVAALCAHILWLVLIAASLQSTYSLTGIRESLRHLIPLTTAGNFLNVVAPSYGIGALAVFMADGSKRGIPAGKVTTGSILFLVYDYISYMVILPIGLVILSLRNALSPVITGSSLIAAAIALFVFVATYLGFRNTAQLKVFLQGFAGIVNRILAPLFHRELIPAHRIDLFIKDITSGLHEMNGPFRKRLIPAGYALLRKASAMLVLYLASRAFQVQLDPGALFASFTIAYLFNIVSVTPSGIGFVEGALTLILASLGVPLPQAAAITVTYRGITFWLTLVYGIFAIRMIGYPLAAPAPSEQTEQTTQSPPAFQRDEASYKRDPRLSS